MTRPPVDRDLEALRLRILDAVLQAAAIVGGFAALTSIWLSARHGVWALVVLDVVAWSALAVAAWRRALGAPLRVAILLGTAWLVAVGVLAATGPFGVGLLWLLGVPCLAAVHGGRRAFYASIVAVAAGLALVFAGAVAGTLDWADLPKGTIDPLWWSMALTSLACLAAAIGLSSLALVDGLVASHAELARTVARMREAETERKALEEQLVLAQKMEVVGQMAGGIAHDFNNVLTVIQAEADFARALVPDGSEASRRLDNLIAATTRAGDLSARLLLFSRQRGAPKEPAEVDRTVDELRPLLSRLAGERIALLASLEVPDARVAADRTALEQVLTNLVANARDAMPDGGRIVLRSRLVVTGDGVRVRLEVEDEGSGMNESVRARVFEPFFTTKTEGTGLGLATVYAIVRGAGGSVDVRSAPGDGSTFGVVLPIAEGGVVRAAAPANSLAAWPTVGRFPRVLVVEDQDPVREVVAHALSQRGCEVVAVDGAVRALECLDDGFDLLLSDVVMPELTGVDLCEEALARGHEIPMLLMSGHVPDDRLAGRIAELAIPVIRKPFTPDELASAVAAQLEDVALDRAARR